MRNVRIKVIIKVIINAFKSLYKTFIDTAGYSIINNCGLLFFEYIRK